MIILVDDNDNHNEGGVLVEELPPLSDYDAQDNLCLSNEIKILMFGINYQSK